LKAGSENVIYSAVCYIAQGAEHTLDGRSWETLPWTHLI